MGKRFLTQADLDKFPSLIEQGYKIGDEVESEDYVSDENDPGVEVPKKPPPPLQ